MKIAFVCGSLEPGKDGVGDYTRKLSKACYQQGIACIIIAINDKFITELRGGEYEGVAFYRIPFITSWQQKEVLFRNIIEKEKHINWVSLQFVSYSFNAKGILTREISFLNKMLSGFKKHIMLHELWIGDEKCAPAKNRIIGYLQRQTLLYLIKKLDPKLVQTSIPVYLEILKRNKVEAQLLPLFSNITNHFLPLCSYIASVPENIRINRQNYIIGCFFGNIYRNWDFDLFFDMFINRFKGTPTKTAIISIGKLGSGLSIWESFADEYKDIEFVTVGEQAEDVISYWFNHFVDFGIVTTPLSLVGKSGSYMAFTEHNLPVVCSEADLSYSFTLPATALPQNVLLLNATCSFKFPKLSPYEPQFEQSVNQFLSALESIVN